MKLRWLILVTVAAMLVGMAAAYLLLNPESQHASGETPDPAPPAPPPALITTPAD